MVKLLTETLTTETQRTLRLHGERLETPFPDRLEECHVSDPIESIPTLNMAPQSAEELVYPAGYKQSSPPGGRLSKTTDG